MLIDFKQIIPSQTLPTFNGLKRMWIKPRDISIKKIGNQYEVFYSSKCGMHGNGLKRTKTNVPLHIDIDTSFLCSIAMYACEGRNPLKGVYTKSASNKGRDISVTNSDHRIILHVINQFENKLGIERNRWVYRLNLFDFHNSESEISWWADKLKVSEKRIRVADTRKSDERKIGYALHGRCHAELSSSIHAAIISNLCEKFLDGKFFN